MNRKKMLRRNIQENGRLVVRVYGCKSMINIFFRKITDKFGVRCIDWRPKNNYFEIWMIGTDNRCRELIDIIKGIEHIPFIAKIIIFHPPK